MLAYCVESWSEEYRAGGFGIGDEGGIHRLEEQCLAVVVATLEQARPASRKETCSITKICILRHDRSQRERYGQSLS